jgi:hypothetical protein
MAELDGVGSAAANAALAEVFDLGRLRAQAASQTSTFIQELIEGIDAPVIRVPVVTASTDPRALLETAADALEQGGVMSQATRAQRASAPPGGPSTSAP